MSGRVAVRHDPRVKQAGEHAASQIEEEEAHVPHGVLDIVAEHPKEQHVAEQMKDVGVEEHVGEQRRRLADVEAVHRHPVLRRQEVAAEQLARRYPEARHRGLAEAAHLHEVDEHVDGDEPHGDVLKRYRFQ